MSVSMLDNQIAFSGKKKIKNFKEYRKERSQEQKDTEKKVVTGGGAVAATTAAANSKAVKSGVDIFSSSKKAAAGMKNITNTAKAAKNVTKQTSSLWTKVCENAKWAKDSIIKWGAKFQNSRFIRPLVQNRVFKYCAGALGYGFGVITLISGLSDIGQVATDVAENLNK